MENDSKVRDTGLDHNSGLPTYDEAIQIPTISTQPTSQQSLDNMVNIPEQIHYPTAVPSVIPIGQCTIYCRSCNQRSLIEIDYHTTCKTHCYFITYCLVGFGFCAPCVYCSDRYREPTFHCSNCGASVLHILETSTSTFTT